MKHTNKLTEGKTKIIWKTNEPHQVLIESKDDITAGDGDRHATMDRKSVWATTTTVNCFDLLAGHDILTHLIQREDETTFLADRVEMIPLELVARRIAWGSFCKRRPDVIPQTRFDQLVTELFEKDDANHDPLVIYDNFGQRILRYNAKRPLSQGFISEAPWKKGDDHLGKVLTGDLIELRRLTEETFLVLEKAWSRQDITLVDLKIECGCTQDGRIVVADVIDNDSWRIWPNGDPEQQLDKQAFRDLDQVSSAALDEIAGKYALVAEATKQFVA